MSKRSESGEKSEGRKKQSSSRNSNSIIVVDASVVAKWFVQEQDTEKALALRNDYIDGRLVIACPDLLGYEVINALRYKPSFGIEQLEQAADALEKYNFLSYSILSSGLAKLAIEFAVRYGLTIYDASYLAVGEYLDSVVYTADITVVEKVANKKRVANISEY